MCDRMGLAFGGCRFGCVFFNDPATTEIYTLSLHDALPISVDNVPPDAQFAFDLLNPASPRSLARISPFWTQVWERSEEHTSELQSRQYLVCRLLLEKKILHNPVRRSAGLNLLEELTS